MGTKLIYPDEPPRELPKPEFKKGKDRPDNNTGLWHIHDPAIFKDDVNGKYYIYCTGADCHCSDDLIHWKRIGKVVAAPPKEASLWTGSNDIWAPDIIKINGEYRLYCSNSKWGVRQSCIFLAVSDNPEGPFMPRGCVLKTTEEMPVNAIDANIVTDNKTGDMYMLYGSFWGGCYMLLLDKETGLAAEDGIGVCVAKRPGWMSAAIEGPYIIYNPATDYYYLFVSYGSLKSDYNVRVARSRNVTGPYTDFNNIPMTDISGNENSTGLLIHCGYRWNDGKAYMAPGHNSVLNDTDGSWYIICHIREHNFTGKPEPSKMQIRKIYWSGDGWPFLSAQPYAGEKEQYIPEKELYGFYERITLKPELPQGITCSVPMKLARNGYYECCSIQGTWKYINQKLHIKYGQHEETAHVYTAWDAEKSCPVIAISGISKNGFTFMAKKTRDI
ncbi:MAG: arabinan endo-1,5-alpha-L-arabinosidase [Lachnospiraceae bacterium]